MTVGSGSANMSKSSEEVKSRLLVVGGRFGTVTPPFHPSLQDREAMVSPRGHNPPYVRPKFCRTKCTASEACRSSAYARQLFGRL